MSLARALAAAFTVQLRLRAASPVAWFGAAVQPLIFTTLGLAMLTVYGGGRHLTYAVIGGSLMGLWGAALFNAGYDIRMEQWMGTLESVAGCPTRFWAILAARVTASVLPGAIAFPLCMAVAAAGFGWRPAVDGAPFAISAALSLVAFASMALVLAPAFVLIRLVPGLTNALESPLYLLCAFMFPATQLPSPIRWIGGALAPSWTTRALFAATDPGAHGTPYAAWWLAAAGLVLANLAVSALLMSRVDRRLRVTGELASV